MVLKQLFGKKEGQKGTTVPSMERPREETAQEEEADAQGKKEPAPAEFLERSMVENARNDNQESRYKVYQELLFSELLLALADAPEGTPEGTVDQNSMNVAILTNSQNVQFAAAFTSPAAAKRWRPEGGNYVSIRGQDLYKLLEPSPAEVIVINAGSAPFIVLPKIEYRQLALGIIPQSNRSPVQMSMGQQEPQVVFRPDIFSDEQKTFLKEVLEGQEKIEGVSFAAVVPPGANPDTEWVRTIFVRTKDVELTQEAMQSFFEGVQKTVEARRELFNETPFQFVPMLDNGFWVAVHRNGAALFDKNPPAAEMQIAFPPDVFTAEQKSHAQAVMTANNQIEAASVGAILPPGADPQSGWVRTVFLRVTGVEETPEAQQKFCADVRDAIVANQEQFKETGFEVGIMPDPNFWVAIHQSNFAMFDKNPPPIPAEAPAEGTQPSGVVDAQV